MTARDWDMAMSERMRDRRAEADVMDEEVLRDLGTDPYACLARCMANLNRACKGEQIALDAICTALSQYQRRALADRIDVISESYAEEA